MTSDRIPESWARTSLAEVCSKITDGTHHSPSAEVQSEHGDYRYITAKNVRETGLDLRDVTYVPEAVHCPIFDRCNPEQGDVLYVKDGVNTGTAAVNTLSDEFSLLSSVALLKPEVSALDARYLRWYLASPAEALTSKMGGTAIKRLTLKKIKAGGILLAPLPEQHRIVAKIEELFSELDAGTQALERAQAKLERYRASVLKAAVEGKLTEQWRKDNPAQETGQELLDRILMERRAMWKEQQLAKYEAKSKKPPKNWQAKYKQVVGPDASDLPGLPEGWCWTQLDEVCEKIQDGTHFSPKAQLTDGLYPYVTAKNVRMGGLDLSDLTFLDEAAHRVIYQRCDAREGDVLLVKDGVNTGDTCINTVPGEISLLSSVCMLRPHASLVLAEYLRLYLFSPTGRRHLLGRMSGTAIRRVILRQIKETPICIPPVAEQARIVDEVARCEPLVEALQSGFHTDFARGDMLRQSILKRAFEGRLVPQEPSDEPASVLLERIRAQRDIDPKKKRRTKKKTPQPELDL